MADHAWAGLERWGQVSEKSSDGVVAFCLGLAATMYFRGGHTDRKRRAALECVQEYLALCGSSLRWWVVEGRTISPVSKLKSLDMSPYLLSRKWNTPAAHDEPWALLWHGGEDRDDASPLSLEALGASALDAEAGADLSFLRVSFPVTWFADNARGFVDLVVRWAGRLEPVHGYGGVTFITSPDAGLAQLHEAGVVALASRHPGLEVDDPDSHSLATGEQIKGGNWLTLLSSSLVERVGGVSWLRDRLGTGFTLEPYSGGVCIVAGDTPEIGDRNRNLETPHLRTLARALKPIRVSTHPPIHTSGRYATEEGFEAWLARFDG